MSDGHVYVFNGNSWSVLCNNLSTDVEVSALGSRKQNNNTILYVGKEQVYQNTIATTP
jgi:hypothetical protein